MYGLVLVREIGRDDVERQWKRQEKEEALGFLGFLGMVSVSAVSAVSSAQLVPATGYITMYDVHAHTPVLDFPKWFVRQSVIG